MSDDRNQVNANTDRITFLEHRTAKLINMLRELGEAIEELEHEEETEQDYDDLDDEIPF